MEEMVIAVDEVMDDPGLAVSLSQEAQGVWSRSGDYDQEMQGNQIVRTRMA